MDSDFEILLIEDNAGDAWLIREALREGDDSRLHVVKDALSTRHFLQRRGGWEGALRPDLILLDLELQGGGGLELLGELKSAPDYKRIPVVVFGCGSGENIARAYEAGTNCYIRKPASPDQFFAVVHAIEDFWLTTARLPRG